MSPSDTLRALLDERGIDHYDHENGEPLRDLSEAGADPATSWRMGSANVCAVPNKQGTFDLWIDNCTPEQAVAATVGNRTDLSKRLREVHGLHAFAELFGFSWEDESDWSWHDVACAMADAIDATVGTDYGIIFAPTLDRPPETMVGETVFDSEGNAIGWIVNATVGVGTCHKKWRNGYGFCSECGCNITGEWAIYCPNCGRKVVTE